MEQTTDYSTYPNTPKARMLATLHHHGACPTAIRWLEGLPFNITYQQAWEQCTRGDWMWWLICCDGSDAYSLVRPSFWSLWHVLDRDPERTAKENCAFLADYLREFFHDTHPFTRGFFTRTPE